MKLNVKALAAATALAGAALTSVPASAASIFVDFSGADSIDEFGDPDNVYGFFDIGAGSHVTGISWDLYMYADSPSWLSEMTIYFGPSDQSTGLFLTPAVGDSFPGSGFYAGSGDLVDLGLDFSVLSDGLLYIELFEAFDDYPDDWDGFYISGGVTVTYDPVSTPAVPEPATWAMMISGLGLAGAFMRRARRAAKVSFA